MGTNASGTTRRARFAIVGIGGMLAQLAQGVADNMIQTTGRLPDPGGLTSSFTPLPLVTMLAFALIGDVFRRGVVLRDDVEGLV